VGRNTNARPVSYPVSLQSTLFARLPRLEGEPVCVVSMLHDRECAIETIKSVVGQSWPNIDWIVINRTMDPYLDTVLRASKMVRKGLKVTVIDEVNVIQAARMSSADWVAFLPDNVRWEKGHIESLMKSSSVFPMARIAIISKGQGYEFRNAPSLCLEKCRRFKGDNPFNFGLCGLFPNELLRTGKFETMEDAAKYVMDSVPLHLRTSSVNYTVRKVVMDKPRMEF
jgi:hypothetical protein